MTVFDRTADRAQIHALVIGVDQYPHCGVNSVHEGAYGELARRLTPLSCAAPSARSIAQWLMKLPDEEAVPLGSLELLLSTTDGAEFAGRRVPPATYAEVQAAFQRWFGRCDERADNIAFFFFCGHGCRMGGEDVLFLADIGDLPGGSFFRNAVGFDKTYLAMRQCRAKIQCYFVDACRDIPEQVLQGLEVNPLPLKDPAPNWLPVKDAPMVYSTVAGQPAFGTANRPTPFAAAVIEALNGRAARLVDQEWEIKTNTIAAMIDDIRRWDSVGADDDQVVALKGDVLGGVVRTLCATPQVPFRIGCDPREALPDAHLRLVNGAAEISRSPQPRLWQDVVNASQYTLYADFRGIGYDDAHDIVLLTTPHRKFDLAVRRR